MAALIAIGLFLGMAPASSRADIVVLSEGSDNGLTAFLTNSFSNITEIREGNFANFNAAATQTALTGADFVVIGRTLSSGDYDNYDASGYNGLTIPVVVLTSYVARENGNRLGWHTGSANNSQSTVGDETTITAAGAAWYGAAGAADWHDLAGNGGDTFNGSGGPGSLGGGTVLATIGPNHILAAHWDAGDAPGNPTVASGTVADPNFVFPGERFLFNLDNDFNTGGTRDLNALTTDGKAALVASLESVGFERFLVPRFTTHPQDEEIILGDAETLEVFVDSALPISLQWRMGSTPIPGATNTTLQIDPASLADEGTYDAVATTTAGSATSDTAVVTVVLPDIDPTAQVVLETFPATFIITMPTNFPSYAYAWNGPTGLISGATSPTLTVVNVTSADTGIYTVDVTASSDVLSASAELTVPAQPTASYTDTVLADSPVAYWRLGDGAAASYAIDETTPAEDLFIGATVVAEQQGALLGDPDTAMAFDGTETSVLDRGGSFDATLNTATFSVEGWVRPTGGSGFRSVVASRDIDTFNGNVTAGYELGRNSGGQWRFRTGTGQTNAAQTEVWNDLVGPFTPMQEWVHLVGTFDGSDMVLYVNGAQAGTLAVSNFMSQVIWDIRVGAGANEVYPPEDFFVGDLDEVAYYNVALSAQDVLDHYAATFDITAPPAITEPPADRAALIGDETVFRVGVISGTHPTYQWRMDGVDIPGATSDTLVLDPVAVTDAGDYDVVVSNAAGSTPSDVATLVPLVDYLGTLVLPDGTNTVLTRDGSSDWFSEEGNVSGKWNRREVFGISPGLTPWGWQGTSSLEGGGDLEVRTTLTGLQPNTDYAVWTLYSTKGNSDGTITGQALRSALSGFDGEGTTEFSPSDESYTGVYAADFWWVYQAYLGVRTSDGAGTIAVLFDYAPSGERTMYQGVGYQEAVPTVIPPVISIPPTSQAVLIGSNATFSVSAGSLVPMTYQWQFDGVDLPGETNDTLTITSVQRADGGTYQVVVSNSEGSVTSDPADLVTLVDYVGTFVFPDSSNTVLTRDGSSDWFTTSQADAESNAQWTARADLSVPAIPGATNGYYAAGANDDAGDIEVRTTVSGLDPTKSYAVWALYSYPSGGDTASRLAAGFEGANLTTWDDINGQDTGIANSLAGYNVYQGLLGIRTPDGSGNLQVLVDYRGGVRSIYTGLGYQLAVLPPDIEMTISLVGGAISVSWPDGSGALQESEDLTNPASWVDVPGATPPYVDPGTASQKAFRLRE